jgi:isopenicillin-N epimerase
MPPPDPIPGARLLFSLEPAMGYLNHGGFGAVPLPVQRAQQRLRDEMESNPHRFFTASLPERIGHARRHVSAFLGADPASSSFVANATAGLTIALRSMAFRAGDEIITTNHGYGSTAIAVDHICARTGATHTIVPIGLWATDDQIVADITRALTPGRTRLVIVDHITSATARIMPVGRVAAATRRHDIALFVDGAHAPGTLDLHVDAIGADFWVGNLHKWMYAPRPAAILSVAAHRRAQIEPPVVSWNQADGFPANVEMQGTIDYTAWLAAPTGLYVLRTLGADRVRAHNAALVAYGQRVVGAALGLLAPSDLPYPGSPGAAMRVLPLPAGIATTSESARGLGTRIADELHVVVAVNAWQGRGLLRLSAQVYNHADDYDRLAAGLPRILVASR